MCGIFGIIVSQRTGIRFSQFDRDLRLLFSLSRDRGRDASGLAAYCAGEGSISVLRHEQDAKCLLQSEEFSSLVRCAFEDTHNGRNAPLAAIGHCRLVTHGSFSVPENNQPAVAGSFVGVHNGIIANADQMARNYGTNFKNKPIGMGKTTEGWAAENDTRILFDCLNKDVAKNGSIIDSLQTIYEMIEGHASISFFSETDDAVFAATDTGSLYIMSEQETGRTVFASEKRFLRDFLRKSELFNARKVGPIERIMPREGVRIALATGIPKSFRLIRGHEKPSPPNNYIERESQRFARIVMPRSNTEDLQRCTKCILPETYPFIRFNQLGVCNYCNEYEKQKFKGRDELEWVLQRYRSKDGSPDCLVGLSGGRDSCWGLHILKNEFEMNPVAYTYDWGLTTDTSRVNQAKVCGKLGIEHIIRAPDIAKKRRAVRKNVHAWLKRPSLGMVPLFMAGDKPFYHFGRKIRDELEVGLTIQCAGTRLEQTDFFVGFCGIDEIVSTTVRLYSYPTAVKAILATYYIKEYLLNPAYINESFWDSIWSFILTFLQKDDFLYLFEYLPWEEKEIEALLEKEYGWKDDKAYGTNQWRMGDGQTAFTNYIWYTVAGFSEYDNFRSHQVREGLLTRNEALALSREDNQPRFEALEYFAYLIGLNLDEVLARINSIPKMY